MDVIEEKERQLQLIDDVEQTQNEIKELLEKTIRRFGCQAAYVMFKPAFEIIKVSAFAEMQHWSEDKVSAGLLTYKMSSQESDALDTILFPK